MKITDLQVDGFGVWKGLTVDSLSTDMTVFYGHNEAGKTTLMQFIRSVMFGFSTDRRSRYVPPVYGGLAGGSMSVTGAHGAIELQRHIDPNSPQDPIGDLAITHSTEGTAYGRNHLNVLTSGIDESIFNNVFAIGLREIQELGALNNTDAAEHLYKLTSGLDRVSLVDVMRDVTNDRNAIWSREGMGKASTITNLLIKRRELEREIDELRNRSKTWTKLSLQTAEINNRLEQIAQETTRLEKESRIVEVAIQVADRWHSRRLVDEQIADLGTLPDERDISVTGLEQLNQRIVQQRERLDQLKRQGRSVKRQADELPIDQAICAAGPRVDALYEHLPWITALQEQVDRLQGEINAIQVDLGGEFDGLGHQLKIQKRQLGELTDATMTQLRGTAKEVVEQREQMARAQEEFESAAFELEEHQERFNAKSSVRLDGGGSLEDAGDRVNKLRRRVELEDKIEKLNQNKHDLELEIDDVVSDQVLTVGKLTIIGIAFVIGVVLLGFGVWLGLESTQQVGMLLVALSAAFGLLSFGLKYHWENVAREELDDFRSQFEMIRQQLKRAKAERDEIDRQIPGGATSWDVQLKDAEGQLQRIEDLIPLENRVKQARQNVEEARRLFNKQKSDVEAAEARWKSTLRSIGLPDHLDPSQLKEVAQRSERISSINVRLEQYQSELAERTRELSSVTTRIDQVLSEIGIEYESTDPEERLQQLKSAITEQRRFQSQRKEFMDKHRKLRSMYAKANRELDALLGRKQRALTVVGADDEDQYRQFALLHDRKKSLQEKRQQLTEQITAALGKIREDDVKQQLEHYGNGLERHWESLQAETERLKGEQSQLLQQRGKYAQEIKTLGEDCRLDEARLELNALIAQLEKAQRQWQALAVSSQVLERLRAEYEAKRQPETLREASYFLEKLTGGQYVRIWTRMVGEELLVDNGQQETLKVELLSRGTREAVFLSLRLALVGAYARRGANLPMILDDVLVNFDADRARAAARVLKEFSDSGYQLLVFTCHDHFRDLFFEIGADVRILPHHKDVVKSNAVPLVYEGPVGAPPPVAAPVVPEILEFADELWQDIPAANTDGGEQPLSSELQYELSAVDSDQQRQLRLRDQLVYLTEDRQTEVDLSGDDDIWSFRCKQRTA